VDSGASVDQSLDHDPVADRSGDTPTRRDLNEGDDRRLVVTFQPGRLYALRAAVAAHGSRLGRNAEAVEHLLIVANELVTNVIRHGGGCGQLRLWRQTNSIYCQVGDLGPGIAEPEQAGTQPVSAHLSAGRGLWIVRRLADECTITSSHHGTTVTVCFLMRDQ
jgi:anti-sigma regulatory factor (Ser/Thr protein kinase)